MRRTRTYAVVAALSVAATTAGAAAVATASAGAAGFGKKPSAAGCQLGGAGDDQVKHVIYLQFDNVHFTRDNPNVPSDLEQMPHLLNFLKSQGTLDDNHHTPLIAHTGNDILTSLTGVYGDKHGQPIANSYKYYTPSGTANTGVSFAYWTDGVFDPSAGGVQGDTAPTMADQAGKVAPAPWVSYTRAGCDFGAVATANTVLENTGPDVPKVFGTGSPEAAEAASNSALAQTDFVGIGVHCAQNSKLCTAAGANAKPDVLADEPGGYTGFKGLFGAKYTDPVISPTGPVKDVAGTTTIADAKGNAGFPGFDAMSAANSLGYVAQMQEAGVPVTYAYLSDAHDNHAPGGTAYGPGQAGYVSALKTYDSAFETFFQRLGKDGINAKNTMFVVTSDENDHFVGGAPTPARCDGVTVPCSYKQIGEIDANAKGLLAAAGNTTPFTVHADSAPNYYLTGNPAASSATARTFEHAVAGLTAVNPITGNTDTISSYLADPVEMKNLHMVTSDPLRTPTFTDFANPDYYVFSGAASCSAASPCVTEPTGFAWNHGDFSPDINTTWLGLVGPGIKHLGVDGKVWSDHTDIRPTMMEVLGLKDDYTSDGVPLTPFLRKEATAKGLRGDSVADLEAAFKQLNGCVGAFGTDTLKASTTAILSNTPGDATYTAGEAALGALGAKRDRLAATIEAVIGDAAFHGGKIESGRAKDLTSQADSLIAQAKALAG